MTNPVDAIRAYEALLHSLNNLDGASQQQRTTLALRTAAFLVAHFVGFPTAKLETMDESVSSAPPDPARETGFWAANLAEFASMAIVNAVKEMYGPDTALVISNRFRGHSRDRWSALQNRA